MLSSFDKNTKKYIHVYKKGHMQIQGFTPNTSEWFPAVRGEGRMGLGVGNRECINKYKGGKGPAWAN